MLMWPSEERFVRAGIRRLLALVCSSSSMLAQVYDVSGFISKHPGGANQLLLGAGRDVTTLFESYHHFNNYK